MLTLKWLLLPLFFMTSLLSAQDFGPKPLPLPKDDPPPRQAGGAASRTQFDPAKQIELWRAQADAGDSDAAFQLGISMLIGNGVPQDSPGAEQYFKKATMTSARDCMVAEAYVESVLPHKLEEAKRWSMAANSACGYWELAQWYEGVQLGPDSAKELESLRLGLAAKDDGLRRQIQARLGELILNPAQTPTRPTDAVGGKPGERLQWMGQAARQRLGTTEWQIANMYGRHADEADARTAFLDWTRRSARYGNPAALAQLGQAEMTRELSDLSFLDGMALYDLGARQEILTAVGEELQRKQLEPEQREELSNADALWQRIASETGGYYTKGDALRLTEVSDWPSLVAAIPGQDPDASLRLAYGYETKGELRKAEELYRQVWREGPAQLWLGLADAEAKAGKWAWARDLYRSAADSGSRQACTALARIDGEGLAGKKDPAQAYAWALLAESKGTATRAKLKASLTEEQLRGAELSQAKWLLAHGEYWRFDTKAVQAKIGELSPPPTLRLNGLPQTPALSMDELRKKADAGDTGAAYQFAINLLRGDSGMHASTTLIEHYAAIGAVGPYEKANIESWYGQSPLFDRATQLKYAERWAMAAGGAQGYYSLAKLYNGKSDGIVKTEDEQKAVAYWRRAVEAGDERWARLSRMELGYRVDKGWSCGDLKLDAAWAHELAMEMMGKEFYQIAGEYSYGRELSHDPKMYLLLAERAAIYNIDNAQGAVANGIQSGDWKHGDDADALAWMKLRAVKQDVDVQVVATAEEDPALKRRIEASYALLLQARAESGAYYPQDDLLRTAGREELEARVKEQDPEAQLRLGALFEAEATAASLKRAIELYRQIWATAGQEARLTWGRALMQGSNAWPEPVVRDDLGAQKWLRDAANYGSHSACRLLATMYAEGRGVPADPVAAEAWRELAGEDAASTEGFTVEQKVAVRDKVTEWTSAHPGW